MVARFDARRVEELLADPGIVRNRLKVVSTVENARRVLETKEELGSFSSLLWAFVDGQPLVGGWKALAELPAEIRVEGDEQGAQAPRLPLRGADGLLRVHAGRRPGGRPRRLVLPLPGARSCRLIHPLAEKQVRRHLALALDGDRGSPLEGEALGQTGVRPLGDRIAPSGA